MNPFAKPEFVVLPPRRRAAKRLVYIYDHESPIGIYGKLGLSSKSSIGRIPLFSLDGESRLGNLGKFGKSGLGSTNSGMLDFLI